LLVANSEVSPADKVPLGSFFMDIEEMHRKSVDPVTGQLIIKNEMQDNLATRKQRYLNRLDK